jgi:hypothetical protein
MPILELDHLVLGAASLADGAPALAASLGVEPDAGGRHEGVGTHNRLVSLGRHTYLELIAPDPGQPTPSRPRPFGLDDPAVAARIAQRPRLLAYVVRTDDIAAARDALGLPPGRAGEMRRGALRWKISLPVQGQPAGTPILIEWGDTPNPSATLPDRGLRLIGLRIGVPAPAARLLAPLADDPRIRIQPSDEVELHASVDAPAGIVEFD